jgi:hypothetical protein
MQTPPIGINNPFAVLTAIVAPAILTNACSVLALGTSNRLGRVVDRTRVVTAGIAANPVGSEEYNEWVAQLRPLETRTHMLVVALRMIYAALGLFATTGLIAIGGSVAAFYGLKVFRIGALLSFITGVCAVVGLTAGCYVMVNETRLAVKSLGEEARMRTRLHDLDKPA